MEQQPPEDSKEPYRASNALGANKRRSEPDRKHNTSSNANGNNITGLTNTGIGATRNSQITIQTNESDNKMYRDDGLELQLVNNQSRTPKAKPSSPESPKNLNRFHLAENDASRPTSGDHSQKTTDSRAAHVESILRKIRTQMAERKEDQSITQAQVEVYVDPTPDLIEGIFYVNQTNMFVRCCTNKRSDKPDKIEVYDVRSLYLFHFETRFRKELVNFTSSTLFENIIILLIFLNTVVLTIYEYDDRDNEREWNQRLELIGEVFTILFAIEMVLKIIAQGLIFHKNAYLKDAWNWLDTIVVVTGILEMMELSWFKVRALRTLRVLRPLRSIKAFPKMRKLVSSLIGSVDSLLNAVAFMLFIFMLFGILGIQQFEGTMYRRCRYTEFPLDDGTWPYDPNLDFLCSKDGQGLMECPPDRFCKEPKDAGLPASIDDPHSQFLIMYGIVSFDNLAWAMLSIFQMITLEGWTIVMYNLMDSNIAWMAVLFCVLLVIMGSFFLLNVILAVLADALNRVDKVNQQSDLKRLKTIQESLDRAQAQHEKKQGKQGPKNMTSEPANDSDKEQDQKPTVQVDSAIFKAQEAVKLQLQASLFQSVQQEQQPDEEDEIVRSQSQEGIVQLHEFNELPSPDVQVERVDDSQASGRSHQSNQNLQEEPNLEEQGSHQARSVFQDRTNNMRMSLDDAYNRSEEFSSPSMTVSKMDFDHEARYNKNCLYYACYKVCTHWSFTLIITLLIIANTVVLAMDKYPEDEDLSEITSILNNIFTYCFIVEMVIKLIGLGFREYSRDSFNIFDAVVVILSIVDIVITVSTDNEEEGQGGALTAFRGARLIRVFKLARSWTSFRQMLSKILVTVKDVSTFTLLLVMFMFIFTLLGMELFGHKVKFDDNDNPVDPDSGLGESIRPNFDNVGMGFTSIFAIAIGDDWNYLMAMSYRTEGLVSIIFFPFVFVFMNLILLNLFLAILLSNFETSHEEDVDHEEKSLKKLVKKCDRGCKRCCLSCKNICPCFFRDVDKEQDEDINDENELAFRRLNTKDHTKLNKVSAMGESSESSSFLNSDGNEEQQNTQKAQQNEQNQNQRKEDEGRFSIIYEDDQENSKGEDSDKGQKKSQRKGEPKVHSGTMEDSSMILYQKRNNQDQQSDSPNQSPRQRSTRSRKPTQNDGQSFEKKKTRVVPIEDQKIDLDQQQGSNEIMVQQNIGQMQQYDIGSGLLKSFGDEKVKASMMTKSGRRRSTGLGMSVYEKNAVKKMSAEIPLEYEPKNFLRIYKQQHDLLSTQILSKDTITEQKRKDLLMSTVMIANTNKAMTLTQLKRQELIEKQGQDLKHIKMVGKSLFIFQKDNWLRQLCYKIVKQSFYDTIVLVLITISTFMLTLDNPNLDDKSDLASVLKVCDLVLTTLFTLECIINVILFGFVCNGKKSYARDPWNVMDLIIVFFSIFTLVLQGQGEQDLSILKIFRMLRVLRPLRFLKRNFGLKIQVISLMKAIPGIGNLLLISMLILMLFGIQAVTLLKGALYYCNTTYVPQKFVPLIKNQWDCWNYGGEWTNNEDNFDNVANAMITMFGMITTEGWLDVLFAVVDSNKIDYIPERNLNPGYILFFGIFMIVGSLFILNLFVGVVISTFNVEKEKLSHNGLMTSLQNEYVEALIKCYVIQPEMKHQKTGNKVRDLMARFAGHDAFGLFIFVCICLNTVVLAIQWYGMNKDIVDVLEIINYLFTIIYSVEMIIKVFAFGKTYFNDGWNVFDFLIVLSAWIGIILLQVFSINIGSITTIIRSFRIARVLKIVKRLKNLQQIFQTFILAIPELVNVGALLVLFLFLFAVLGVSLFAEVKLQDSMDRHANFENFYRASLTLLRVATGEGWVGIMYDAGRQPSVDFTCIEEQSFESKQAIGIQGCGSPAAYFFFVSFILMVSLVFLNLFIAIILEGFAASSTEQNLRVGEDCIDTFIKHWQKYDPLALGFMEANQLQDLILDLIQEEIEISRKTDDVNINFNLRKLKTLDLYTQWQREIVSPEDREYFFKDFSKNKLRQRQLKREMKKFLMSLQIPLYYSFGKVNFHDTLNAIIRRVYFLLHELEVENRNMIIQKKVEFGERLKDEELMKVGSKEFWHMTPKQKEIFMETRDKDFQKVINRLENKNNQERDPPILKLNYLRRLRQKQGRRHQDHLDMFEGVIYDSSHIIGLQVILKAMARRRKNKELKLLRSSMRDGPPTARNTQNFDPRRTADENATQVFQSENKQHPSALSKYDSDKNGQLQSNDTLGLEKYEADQPRLFDQSFKMATDDDKQNDGQEPQKIDSATNSQGLTQFSADVRSTKNRFSLMKELEETMDQRPNISTNTKHEQLNDSILQQNIEMDIIDEEVKQNQHLSLLSGIVSAHDKVQTQKVDAAQISPQSRAIDLESTEELKEIKKGVDLKLARQRSESEDLPESPKIQHNSSNDNSKDLMTAAQEELLLASQDRETRNVRSSQEKPLKSNQEHSQDSRNQDVSSMAIQQPQESRMSSTTYGQFNSKFRSQRHTEETPLQNRTPLHHITSKSQRVSLEGVPKEKYNSADFEPKASPPTLKAALNDNSDNNYQDSISKNQAGIATRNLNTFKRENQRTPMRESRITQQVGSNIIGSKPTGFSNSQPKKSSAPEAVRSSQSQQDTLINLENVASNHKRQMHKNATTYGLFAQKQSNQTDDPLIAQAQQHLQQHQPAVMNHLTASSQEANQEPQNYGPGPDRFKQKTHDRSSKKLIQTNSKGNLVAHDQTWFQGSPAGSDQAHMAPVTRNMSPDQQLQYHNSYEAATSGLNVDDYSRSMNQTRYDDGNRQGNMQGKNAGAQQFMKTQLNFMDPQQKIKVNNSVIVPPQPQINNSLNSNDQRAGSRSSTLKKLQDQGIIEVANGMVVKPQPFIDSENPLPTLRQRATIEQITSPDNPQLTRSIDSQNSIAKRKKKNQNYDSGQKAGSRSSKNKSSIGSLNSMGEPKKKKREQSRLTKIMNVYKNDSMEDRH